MAGQITSRIEIQRPASKPIPPLPQVTGAFYSSIKVADVFEIVKGEQVS
jgi:hypothetical protein